MPCLRPMRNSSILMYQTCIHDQSLKKGTCNLHCFPGLGYTRQLEGQSLHGITSCTAWSMHTCARQVEAANAEVERGNQARQSDFSGAADRLRKLSTAEYEARRPLPPLLLIVQGPTYKP